MEKQSINMPVAIAGVKRMKPSTFHRDRELFEYFLKNTHLHLNKMAANRNVTVSKMNKVVSKGLKENWANHKKSFV